ncbi:hypothetical protein [Rhizobium leguminosarum]|uniref:hypothetical protein n=1 Tax=Rhizobium leguminosarum TaxID=384 RepID=UPI001441B964|nr:hypothetical protein [Rhizobium leguminosarum]NKJ77756.1 hypothetical protein [Rhizobium leguminosarum bv. viciae]
MADRYLVLDQNGAVVNNVVGFVDSAGVGLVPQTDELMHVGLYWVYDATLDEFTDPYNRLPPPEVEPEAEA